MTARLRAVWAGLVWGWDHSLGWVLMWALILPIRAYQVLISPLTPPSCRYHPVCSTYAVKAIRRHGAIKGFLLGSWRVVRCNPWSRGGLDPVPRRGRWLPDVLPDGRPRSGTMRGRGPAATV